MESSYPSLELRSAPCRPNTDHILRCEEDQQEAFLEIKTIAPQTQGYASFLGSYHVDEFWCNLLFVFTDGADHTDDQAEEHDEKPARIQQNIELAAACRCSSSTITRHTMQQDNDCQANRSLTIAPLHGAIDGCYKKFECVHIVFLLSSGEILIDHVSPSLSLTRGNGRRNRSNHGSDVLRRQERTRFDQQQSLVPVSYRESCRLSSGRFSRRHSSRCHRLNS